MLIRYEFGNLTFQPRNLCFADGEGGDGGGAGAGEGADTGTGGEGGDTQPGGEGGDAGKTKLGAGGDALEGGDKDAPDWRAGITDPDLQKVASKYSSPTDLAKAYRSLEQRQGKMVALPGKDAKPEDVAAFHKALGVPEKPEEYKVEIPEAAKANWGEADEALKGSFLKNLHAAGATPGVVNAAMGWYFQTTQQIAEQQAAAAKKATEEAEAALQKEWGADAKANDQVAGRAAKEFGDEAFLQFLEEKEVDGIKLGNHPAFRKAFAAIGRAMSEDKPLIGGDSDAAQTAQERIDELHALQDSNPQEYKSQKVQNELRTLYSKLYGAASADGRAA